MRSASASAFIVTHGLRAGGGAAEAELLPQITKLTGVLVLYTVFGSWSLGCSRLLLAAPAVRLLGLLLAASLLLACCWLLVADGCCCCSRKQPVRQLPNTVYV